MASCAKPDSSGYLQLSTDAPQSCTGYIVISPDELSRLISPLWQSLTVEDGSLISAAILGVWVTAFCFRVLRDMLNPSNHSGD